VSVSTGSLSDKFIVRVIVGAVVLGIGIFLLSTVFSVTFAPSGFGSVPLTNGETTLDVSEKRVDVVQDTSGRAASLGGSGAVVVSGGLGFLNETETSGSAAFATHAAVDDPNRTQIIYALEDEYQLSYNGTSNEYVLWYFDKATTNSYVVTIAATNPTQLQPIFFSHDGDTLTLETTAGEGKLNATTTTGGSFVPLPTDTRLDGTLEETRTFDRTLTNSEQNAYTTDPIAPIAVGNREARIMYDTAGSGVAVDFRANASGELQGDADRGTGIAADVLTQGTDFALTSASNGKQTLTALNGGQLQDMPRVFLGAVNDASQLIQLVSVAFGLAALVLLIVVAAKVISVTQAVMGG
jgi:hypothetical protein